jgi:hypothetical protein
MYLLRDRVIIDIDWFIDAMGARVSSYVSFGLVTIGFGMLLEAKQS